MNKGQKEMQNNNKRGYYLILQPIFQAQELIITYGLKPFDICESNVKLWQYIKILHHLLKLIKSQ